MRTIWLILVAAAIVPILGIFILNWENIAPSLNFGQKQTTTVISPTPSPAKFLSKSSCVILDEEYCKTGTVVNYQGKFFGLAFKVTEGTKIYAPFDGVTGNSRTYTLDKKQYPSLTVNFQLLPQADQDNISFSAVTFANSILNNSNTKLGEEVGEISEKTIDVFGNYNLVLSFQRFNPKTRFLETDFGLFSKYFNYVQK